MPSRRAPRGSFPVDLAVFLAILATGVVLVLVGHASPEALAGYASALAGLYAAWHHRPRADTRRNPPEAPPASER
ncbi:hypothetical protein Snoj_01250 [Streptomyces nojiriensis]|uniref:Uncharacterized protein n=1 Tax=Streptomyces nojiriensis TaxID=66374 RepID=A0ABQ3SDJ9_9ACTN|nr:hypothetical protein [Streptomyces nojiriensis]QTI42345.1 hypothetical protein JYK04_00102 [Streptomyces nojiriensis]GGS34296.1 hypothetical protein GCM10010205_75540 [Streptomyces nojiriensis]GHI66207.1 hypothetical protein Snoj_01250 [Streptomyces nojiriensis]